MTAFPYLRGLENVSGIGNAQTLSYDELDRMLEAELKAAGIPVIKRPRKVESNIPTTTFGQAFGWVFMRGTNDWFCYLDDKGNGIPIPYEMCAHLLVHTNVGGPANSRARPDKGYPWESVMIHSTEDLAAFYDMWQSFNVGAITGQMCARLGLTLQAFRDLLTKQMEESPIGLGDLVRLKSGGVTMTVSRVDADGRCSCAYWVPLTNSHKREMFALQALVRV